VLIPLVRTSGVTDYTTLMYGCSALFAVALLTSGLMVLDIRRARRAMLAA